VGIACNNISNGITGTVKLFPRTWHCWWVISVKINETLIHLVYPRESYWLPERDLPLLLTRDIEVAEDALFLVYNDKAYMNGTRLAEALIRAIETACSPEISILISETENVGGTNLGSSKP
jgi:hypothetical protein